MSTRDCGSKATPSNMSQKTLVSVIIIFLDAAEFITEAVESILAQTYSFWKLILVDDGSTDGSSEIAISFATRFSDNISYLEHDGHQNLGMSASRNLGISHAKGQYIAFLDADDYWLPDKLEKHVSLLDSNPKAGMLYGSSKYWFSWTHYPNANQQDYVPEFRVKSQTLFTPPELLLLFLEGKTEIPCPSSILVRTEVIKQVGGFEESFRGMYEDQAFFVKICLSTPVFATGDCLTWYRQHPKSTYSVAISSDRIHTLHYSFLKWLENFCHAQNVGDKRIWQAIRRQQWLYDISSHWKLLGLSQNTIRWIKKWLLRIAECILPQFIRNRFWKYN